MKSLLRAVAASALALATACTDAAAPNPAGLPGAVDQSARSTATDNRITVLSRNLYVGADVDAVIAALASPDPADDLPALLSAIATVQATDFPARAAALAREIGESRPHVVGLQEVSQLDVDLTPLGIPVVVHNDFLPTLLAALNARGLHYRVAGTVANTVAAPLPGVSLQDFDAVLVDDRVTLGPTVIGQNFSNNIGVVAPGVTIIRGYVVITATVEQTTYTIADTHLESGGSPGLDLLRAAQAAELATVVGSAPRAILLGDFNDVVGSPMYQVLAGAGFADAWGVLRRGSEGFTCCQVADLSNPVSALDQRIDYVWARGLGRPGEDVIGRVRLVGAQPASRVPGPLYMIWPSDHAGVLASLVTGVAGSIAIR